MHIHEKLYNGKFYGFLILLCEKYSVLMILFLEGNFSSRNAHTK